MTCTKTMVSNTSSVLQTAMLYCNSAMLHHHDTDCLMSFRGQVVVDIQWAQDYLDSKCARCTVCMMAVLGDLHDIVLLHLTPILPYAFRGAPASCLYRQPSHYLPPMCRMFRHRWSKRHLLHLSKAM